jgi:hypothetical protein
MICIRVYRRSAAGTTFFWIPSQHRSGTHLNRINWVHNRMFLSTGQCISSLRADAGARREAGEAYSYAGERACEHVLEQGKVGRERLIAIFPRVSNRYDVFKAINMALGEVFCVLIFLDGLCIWLGHWGHGHRSSSVRIRLQSQDADFPTTPARKRRRGISWENRKQRRTAFVKIGARGVEKGRGEIIRWMMAGEGRRMKMADDDLFGGFGRRNG